MQELKQQTTKQMKQPDNQYISLIEKQTNDVRITINEADNILPDI